MFWKEPCKPHLEGFKLNLRRRKKNKSWILGMWLHVLRKYEIGNGIRNPQNMIVKIITLPVSNVCKQMPREQMGWEWGTKSPNMEKNVLVIVQK